MGERVNPYRAWHGAMVPAWLLRRTELSMGAKLAYARLAQYAGENGHAYPAVATLGAELGVTDRQARAYLAELKTAKLIEQEDDPKHRVSSRYYFLRHPWMDQNGHGRAEENFPPAGDEGRKDASPQGGSDLPPSPEEDFPPGRKDSSAKENQGREPGKRLTEAAASRGATESDEPAVEPWLAATPENARLVEALAKGLQAWRRNHPAKPKAKPVADVVPMPGTDARKVFDALLADGLLSQITTNPGDFATRVTHPAAYPGVDVLAEVLRAGMYAARYPGRYTDGQRFLGGWLRRAAADVAHAPKVTALPLRPAKVAPAPVSETFVDDDEDPYERICRERAAKNARDDAARKKASGDE